ncbi:MAG: hypothetical protein WEC34_04970 [Acidimicrobiia bacterium]
MPDDDLEQGRSPEDEAPADGPPGDEGTIVGEVHAVDPGDVAAAAAAGGSREAPPQMPSRTAFFLAFGAVVAAGLFGGIIGYGLADVGCTGDCEGSKLFGTLIGSTVAAGGIGIVAVLVLRAMAEWKRNPRDPNAPRQPKRS